MKRLLAFFILSALLSACSTVLVTDCKPDHLTLEGKTVLRCSKAE